MDEMWFKIVFMMRNGEKIRIFYPEDGRTTEEMAILIVDHLDDEEVRFMHMVDRFGEMHLIDQAEVVYFSIARDF